jgi:hypothetical protein
MRRGDLDPRSVAAVRTKALENLNHPEIEATRLPGHALNLLTGQRHLPVDELRAELAAVTAEQVHAVAAEAAASTLLQTPRGTGAVPAGFAAAPTSSPAEAAGRRYAPREAVAARLVIGPDAVGITRPGSRITVRYRDCAALLAWPDGARRLIGYDGVTLHLEPALWTVPEAALAAVDAAVAADRHILMPPRDPDAVPRTAAAVPTGPVRRLVETAGALLRRDRPAFRARP